MRTRYIFLADLLFIALATSGVFALRFNLRFLHYRLEFLSATMVAALTIETECAHWIPSDVPASVEWLAEVAPGA